MMFVQLNRASLAAVNTLVHYIFICRAVTLMFPVTESKHHNSVKEGPFDYKEAELCQAVQKSRSVGHLCKPEQNESLSDPCEAQGSQCPGSNWWKPWIKEAGCKTAASQGARRP